MSGLDPIGRDLSRERAARRLGPDPACVLCGERDPEVLAKRDPSVLEHHHVAGHANDAELTVVLCLNCHRRVSASMPAYGVDLRRRDRQAPERLIGLLRGLAVFFELLAASLQRWAQWVTVVVRDLDERDPDWRTRGEE